MDLNKLQKGGAKIQVLEKKGPDPDIIALAEVLKDNGALIAQAMDVIAKTEQKQPIVNTEIAPPEVNISSPDITVEAPAVTINQPKKLKLKRVVFNILQRDQLGNLASFEAMPEYEK